MITLMSALNVVEGSTEKLEEVLGIAPVAPQKGTEVSESSTETEKHIQIVTGRLLTISDRLNHVISAIERIQSAIGE